MILIFNRKVIPINEKEARIETEIVGFIDSSAYEIGKLCFPSKQSWTKFWGSRFSEGERLSGCSQILKQGLIRETVTRPNEGEVRARATANLLMEDCS